MKTFFKNPLFVGLLTLLCCLASRPGNAQDGGGDGVQVELGGGLLVTPKRVVFSERTRSAEISLVNRGGGAKTYRVSFVEMRMDENGRLVSIDDPEQAERPASALVRYSPRQVTVEPGSRQAVRLFVRKPADLEPGEYRSHLLLHTIPEATEGHDVETVATEENSFAFRVKALPGISIPVIVRHGELPATVELSGVGLEKPDEGAPRLTLELKREGERSVFGDLAVDLLAGGRDPLRVGLVKGVAVYTTTPSRPISIPLHVADAASLNEARVRLAFRSRPDDDGGGSELFAEREVTLP